MIDVFIRTTSGRDLLRDNMTFVSSFRWRIDTEIDNNVYWIEDNGILEGRLYAENHASSDPYIFTDDDVLIVGRDWVKRAVDILMRHPEYGAVSTLSLIESENQAIGEGEIYPVHAVGAPMLIRKGLMADLPEMDLNSECSVIYEHLLKKGRKEGLLDCRRVDGLRHIHMGHGFSSNPALFWGY